MTGDDGFIDRWREPLARVRFLIGAWELGIHGLIDVPPVRDWADEYVQYGA